LLVRDCPTHVSNRAFPDRNLSGKDYAAIPLDFGVQQMTVDVIDWRITQHTTTANWRIAFTP
jgi:hypothetical protein